MTIETQAVELNGDELETVHGGFRLEHDADPVVSKPKKKEDASVQAHGNNSLVCNYFPSGNS